MTAGTLTPVLPQALAVPKTAQKQRFPADRWGWIFLVVIGLGWLVGLGAGFERGLTVLTFVGFAAVLAGLRMPVVGLLGAGMLCSLDALTRNYLMFLRWNTFNYVLLLIMFLHLPVLLKVKSFPLRMLQLLIALLVVELVYTNNAEEGIQHVLGPISCFGLVVCFARIGNDARTWSWLGMTTGVLAALGGLVFNLQKGGMDDINKNAWAFFPLTAIFTICLGYRLAGGRGRFQLALLGLALMNAGWVFLSGSRGALLVTIFCMLYLLGQIRSATQRVSIIALGVIVGIIMTSQFADLEENSLKRLERLFDSDRSIENRTSGRSDLAKAGFDMFVENPLLGVGTGGFLREYAQVSMRQGLTYRAGQTRAAHSGWIKILAENALPGILLFGLFIGSFFLVGWKKRHKGLFPIGALVTGVLAVSFLSTEFQAKGLWLLVAGSAILLTKGFAPRRRLVPGLPAAPSGLRVQP
jgi:O-antigen ligase